MNVHLTPELERLLEGKVKSGRYNSASEVVREALRFMEQRDEVLALRKQDIREQIALGLKSLREGRKIDGESVFRRMLGDLSPSRTAKRRS